MSNDSNPTNQPSGAAEPGGGKYEPECTEALLKCGAQSVLLIVFGGDRGDGFSIAARPTDTGDLGEVAETILKIPYVLRSVADQIEAYNLQRLSDG